MRECAADGPEVISEGPRATRTVPAGPSGHATAAGTAAAGGRPVATAPTARRRRRGGAGRSGGPRRSRRVRRIVPGLKRSENENEIVIRRVRHGPAEAVVADAVAAAASAPAAAAQLLQSTDSKNYQCPWFFALKAQYPHHVL